MREHTTLRGQILALATIVLLVLGACASTNSASDDGSDVPSPTEESTSTPGTDDSADDDSADDDSADDDSADETDGTTDDTGGDPSLISTCVETTHTELEGGFPSYLTFTIEVEGVADGTTVSLQADGVNDGEPFEGTVENGKVLVEAGIRSYDDYATPTLVIDPDGAAVSFPSQGLHTVDDAEGEDSQTCF